MAPGSWETEIVESWSGRGTATGDYYCRTKDGRTWKVSTRTSDPVTGDDQGWTDGKKVWPK